MSYQKQILKRGTRQILKGGIHALGLVKTMLDLSWRKPAASCTLQPLTVALGWGDKKRIEVWPPLQPQDRKSICEGSVTLIRMYADS